jgi:hypothetical protein
VADLIEEATTISAAIGVAPVPYASLVLLGWRGDDATATGIIEAILPTATARGEGMAITGLEYAAAVLHNGRGRYALAFTSAERSAQYEEPGVSSWVLPELSRPPSAPADPRSQRPPSIGSRPRPRRQAQTGRSAWRRNHVPS